MRRVFLSRMLVVSVPLLAAACGSRPRSNILLITVDTCRADRLGCYGYASAGTPIIDRLAGEGTLFGQAVSHVPLTLPSHASILTGELPPSHRVRDNGSFFLEESRTTVAEYARGRGYTTAAFIGAFVLASQFGLGQGFDHYDEDLAGGRPSLQYDFTYAERPAERVTRAAVRWLREDARPPFFMWVHYFDPHAPYAPPEPYAGSFAERPYDGEIAYTDEWIGRLLDVLAEAGLAGTTAVILTSDHGEGLGEHSEPTHGVFVYETTLWVPLIVRLPGKSGQPRRVDALVRLADLAPTMLDLMGPGDRWPMEGRSLLPLLKGESPLEPRFSYFESFYARLAYGWSGLRGIRSDEWKYIAAPAPELYSMTRDPGETRNVVDEFPEVARQLRGALLELVREDPSPLSGPSRAEPDRETLAMLRALGYVGGPSAPAEAPGTEGRRPDPKRMTAVLQLLEEGVDHLMNNRFDQAVRVLQAARDADPGNPEAVRKLAKALRARSDVEAANDLLAQAVGGTGEDTADGWERRAEAWLEMGEIERALADYRRAIELFPAKAELHNSLGTCYGLRGDLERAGECFHEALRRDPAYADAHLNLARLAARTGDQTSALTHYARALELEPDSVEAGVGISRTLLAMGKADEAADHLLRLAEGLPPRVSRRRADVYAEATDLLLRIGRFGAAEDVARALVISQPGNSEFENKLGTSLACQNRWDEAAGHFRRALEIDPANANALTNLGGYHHQAKEWEQAIEAYEKALELRPGSRPILRNLYLVYTSSGRTDEAEEIRKKLDETPPPDVPET